MKYRTIVADPPWHYKSTLPGWQGATDTPRSTVPYGTMSIDEIAALPVRDLANVDAHLYLWTTNTHMEYAWKIARAWGFKPSTTLVWCKPPRGFAGFPTYNSTTEFVLFCRRGSLKATQRIDTSWFEWPRGSHSAKPEAFLDMVEQVSPGPYLELFARRNRLGWDTWGNECCEHISLEATP
ncbi:MAG: MT-A70 family methyltransferase [Actinobacteria bacterium]|nr:MT-A70 family methyltransferase [Actinomycetota bacterium]